MVWTRSEGAAAAAGRGRKREGERGGEVAVPRGSGDLDVGGGLPVAATSGRDGDAEADGEG
jgi:hypothetical protein